MLSDEFRTQTAQEFLIFEDSKSLEWGENWRRRINESLNEVTFLIAILTPNYFKSPDCRGEMERFLEREKKVGRDDLVLAIHLVETPGLFQSKEPVTDQLIKTVSDRQPRDWTQLRLKSLTSQGMRKQIAELAQQVRQRLKRSQRGKT